MMGISVYGASYVYEDNMSVIHNDSKPNSRLKAKWNAIAYHAIQESVVMWESLTEHTKSEENPAELFNKIIIGQKRRYLVSLVLYDIYDGDT